MNVTVGRLARPGWTLIGAVAAVALCLPWTTAHDGSYIPGWYAPGGCVTVYGPDGYASMECSPGFVSAGFYTGGWSAAPGYATSMRVFLLVAVLLLIVGHRRGRPRVSTAGLIVAGAGFGVNLGAQAGQLLFLAALFVAFLQLRQPSTAITSPATSRIRSSSSAP